MSKCTIPSITFFDLFDLPEDATKGYRKEHFKDLNNRRGTLSGRERLFLVVICQIINAEWVFEIGTFLGDTAWMLAKYLPSKGGVVTLDLPRELSSETEYGRREEIDDPYVLPYATARRYAGTPEAARIMQLWGDSAKFNPGPLAGHFDLVFVDGAHDPEAQIMADSRLAFRLVREGGWVVWHDSQNRQVHPAVSNTMCDLVDRGYKIVNIRETQLSVCQKE